MKDKYLTTEDINNILMFIEICEMIKDPLFVDAYKEVTEYLEELSKEGIEIDSETLLGTIKQIKREYKRPEPDYNPGLGWKS